MIPIRDYRPSGVVPYVTVALILINMLAYVYQLTLSDSTAISVSLRWVDGCAWQEVFGARSSPPGFDPQLYRVFAGGRGCQYPVSERSYFVIQYGLIPGEFWRGQDLPPTAPLPVWATILTSMFLHGGLLHLLGNMLYLWIFGDNVEGAMGHAKFFLFYLACGVGGAVTQAAVAAGSTAPMIGASGAIAGVLGAYLILFPWSRVLTLVPIFFFIQLVEVPAVIILGLWFVIQFLSGLADLSALSGVAWFAHLGGFLTGAMLVFPLKRRHVAAGLVDWLRRRRSPWGW
ncbi:MAG: rhomboid family intramembrane serine protease [Candidatus Bipolaricaulaceae bacterium]